MVINIDIFYSLKKYCKDRLKGNDSVFELVIEGKDEIKLPELISLINIPQDEVGFATKSNVKFDWNEPILDGDTIKIYPVIIAG